MLRRLRLPYFIRTVTPDDTVPRYRLWWPPTHYIVQLSCSMGRFSETFISPDFDSYDTALLWVENRLSSLAVCNMWSRFNWFRVIPQGHTTSSTPVVVQYKSAVYETYSIPTEFEAKRWFTRRMQGRSSKIEQFTNKYT
jgi:hypothetical protein